MTNKYRRELRRTQVQAVLRELEQLQDEYERLRPLISAYVSAYENPYAEQISDWRRRKSEAEDYLARVVETYLRHGRVRDLRRILDGSPYSIDRQADIAWFRHGSYLLRTVYGVRP
jgi:hypothetical protein